MDRRIHVLLRREGWLVNVKRVHRLYCLEGLQMRHKPPRRRIMAKLRDDRSIRIAAFEIVPEGRFVASFKMLPLAVALLEASRSRSALPNAL